MVAFLVIAFFVFMLFSKSHTIAKKKDAANGNDMYSAFVFTVFMFICTLLWLGFKYAFKSTVLALVCLIFWPNIKNFFNEQNSNEEPNSEHFRAHLRKGD